MGQPRGKREKGDRCNRTKKADPIAQDVRAVGEEEARNLENEIAILVSQEERRNWAEQCSIEKKELEIYKDKIEKENQIKQEQIMLNLSQEREDWIAEANFQKQEFELQKNWLEKEGERINHNRNSLEEKEKELIRIKKEINCYTSLLTLVEDRDRESDIEHSSIPKSTNLEPEDLGDRWIEMLESKNQILPESIAIGYLVSTITALCSGSMVLLNGTVGVGKSSMVRKSAKLLGGNSEIIPIRPSWLDPSDLLGFFDPLSETFRPSSFTTALKKAAKYPDRPFLICLDELNLARIENYGADLLSILEYSKDKAGAEDKKRTLSLYSEDIEIHLWDKLKLLRAEENLTIEQKLLIAQLDRTLSTMKSECEIPQNLILVGTLNSDETTYDLSPKVIDRSYVITYPLVDFKAVLSKGKNNISEQLSISKFQEKVKVCMDCMDESTNFLPAFLVDPTDIPSRINDSWKKDWARIIKWNEDYISYLGIPLGHRVKRDYQMFFAVSHCLGITNANPKRCLSYFILAKLLPRISFFKDKDKKLEYLCQQWIEEIRQDYLIGDEGYILEELERQILDSGRRNVRYWG
ncbi:AAA family ATPase [Chamaesiphon polymorphus]|uniref:ATPase dynein-related AAA domain-containing protein n=1 Tax=Chamaesiphon polymorphus CCALA 037 TaxID=2107692 RepID=A0A2T1GJS4_9CYAN|nr:AAA family ATPase [Chamaesiphon polymorphus]PSB58050.1 hypothetical protein C7B77_06215 [Chamaesiphon polymorphus CCALA 037]